MRKIVWFDYHKNYGGTWLICLLTCIAFFLQQKMKYPYLSVIAVLVSNLFLRNKGESQIPYIPQTVFLVPTSLEIRKGYVKRKFCLRCCIQVVYGEVIINMLWIILYSKAMFWGSHWSDFLSSFLIFLMMCSCFYLSNFNSYFQSNEIGNIEGIVWGLIYKVALLILGILINHHMFEGQGLIYLAAYVLSFFVDYNITKKHFNNMVDFYADYEYSRGMKPFQI